MRARLIKISKNRRYVLSILIILWIGYSVGLYYLISSNIFGTLPNGYIYNNLEYSICSTIGISIVSIIILKLHISKTKTASHSDE